MYVPLAAFPLISLFDSTGKGIPGTRAEFWNIANGLNGTPDMRGRFGVGAINGVPDVGAPSLHNSVNPALSDASTKNIIPNYNIAGTGGEVNHKLIGEETPIHDHKQNASIESGSAGGGSTVAIRNPWSEDGGYTDKFGGDKYHNNLPPYFAGIWIQLMA
jgi:hypothetical protein